MPVSNVSATQARTVYASTGGSSLRGRAAAANGNVINTSATGLLLTYFIHTGISIYVNYRSFLNFDLSSLSGTVTAVSLTLTRINSGDFPDQFILASEAGDNLATTDYLDGIVGASSYPFTSDATKFIDSAETLSDGGGDGDTFTINLNAAAVSHANAVIGTSNRFKCVFVNTHDFNDTYDAGFSNALSAQGIQVSSTDDGTSADYPILNVTTADAAAPTKLQIKGGSLTLKGGSLTIK
jgi:hypothetical protein